MDNNRKENKVTRGLGVLEDSLVSPLAEKVCKTKIAKKISPNLVSALKIIPAFIFFIALFLINAAVSKILVMAISCYIFSFLDRLDGAFARIQKKTSKFGAKLDAFVDKAFEIASLVALGFYFNQELAFLMLTVFIFIITCLGNKKKNKRKRQEDLRDYYRKLSPPRLLILIALIITRNDIRRLVILISTALFLPNLLLYYFFGAYLLNFIKIINLGYKH